LLDQFGLHVLGYCTIGLVGHGAILSLVSSPERIHQTYHFHSWFDFTERRLH
jgi:hypothetical protein